MQMYLKQKQRLAEQRKEYESLEADIKAKSKWQSLN